MVVQAFFDDSGNSPDQEVLVIGGPISTAEKWVKFTAEWKAALAEAPGAAFVKYKEIMRGKGQFGDDRGWTEELRLERLRRFAKIIADNCIGFVFAAAYHEHFGKLVQPMTLLTRNLLTDTLYPHVALMVFSPTVALLESEKLSEPCDCYFDTSPGTDVLLHSLWDDFKARYQASLAETVPEHVHHARLGSIDFRTELELLPLQAADLIAGMARDFLLTGERKPTGPFEPLNDMPFAGDIAPEAETQRWAKRANHFLARFVARFPDHELIGFDPNTAARTRKRIRRELKDEA